MSQDNSIIESIEKNFGNRLRVRVGGILIEEGKMLVIKHHSLGPDGIFWAPPGGGVEFGDTLKATLHREFLEEIGLNVSVGDFLFFNEFLAPPLHGIELFFSVTRVSGELVKGKDPELEEHTQIIQEVGFLSVSELQRIPKSQIHRLFHNVTSLENLLSLGNFLEP